MEPLANKSCVACEGGVPPLNDEEIGVLVKGIDEGWSVIDSHHLERFWSLTDFLSALDFVNSAGSICESEGHHADFDLGWGRVGAKIWTHKIDGLTESDFILAAKFDQI